MRGIPNGCGARRSPAGEDVGFEQPLPKRLRGKLLLSAKVRFPASDAFGLYAGKSRDALVVISDLDLVIARGRCGIAIHAMASLIVTGGLGRGWTIPAIVFSANPAQARHVL
jgi:hypothetical protein